MVHITNLLLYYTKVFPEKMAPLYHKFPGAFRLLFFLLELQAFKK